MWNEVEKQYQECCSVITRIVRLADLLSIAPTNGWLREQIGWSPATIREVGEGRGGDPELRVGSLKFFLQRLMRLETDLEMLIAKPFDDEAPEQQRERSPRRGRDAEDER
mgnify:CR=1 FL=1|tara:strand:- start:72 stop:401 length:330 start_codon:yes stop_codon:yes gene_type:complete